MRHSRWRTILCGSAAVAVVACAMTGGREPQPIRASGTVTESTRGPAAATNEIPVGQQLDVRLQSTLSSATANVEDRFEATTAAQSVLDRGSLEQALAIASQPEAALERFHAGYEFTAHPPVGHIEIVTAFRHAVITAHRQAAASGEPPDLSRLDKALPLPRAGMVLVAVVLLDPHHGFSRPPAYSVRIFAPDARLDPVTVQHRALGPRRARIPSEALGGSVSMAAVEIEARFAANPFRAGCSCRVLISDPMERMIAVVNIDAVLR